MKLPAFLVFILILTLGLFQLYNSFRYEFSGVDSYKREAITLQKLVKQEKFKREIQQYEMSDFQQQVGALIPEAKKELGGDKHKSQELRQIASLVINGDKLRIDFSGRLFEQGKEYFRSQEYQKTIETMRQLISEHPFTKHLVEAHFLLAESQYMVMDYSSCLETIDTMLTQFPESDFTGFILLRMGQIYEARERKGDAAEVYQTVIRSYVNPNLKKQAKNLLNSVGT